MSTIPGLQRSFLPDEIRIQNFIISKVSITTFSKTSRNIKAHSQTGYLYWIKLYSKHNLTLKNTSSYLQVSKLSELESGLKVWIFEAGKRVDEGEMIIHDSTHIPREI